MRTFNVGNVSDAILAYDSIDLDVPWWLSNDRNIALTNEGDDIALFEFVLPGIYSGHYFFYSRGKVAKQAAEEFLSEVFNGYDVEIIRGLILLQNLGARWMSKQLGFKSYGCIETTEGPCELVILTKQEWINNG